MLLLYGIGLEVAHENSWSELQKMKKRRYEIIDHDPETEAMLLEAVKVLRGKLK